MTGNRLYGTISTYAQSRFPPGQPSFQPWQVSRLTRIRCGSQERPNGLNGPIRTVRVSCEAICGTSANSNQPQLSLEPGQQSGSSVQPMQILERSCDAAERVLPAL